jgi:hypothetical protein
MKWYIIKRPFPCINISNLCDLTIFEKVLAQNPFCPPVLAALFDECHQKGTPFLQFDSTLEHTEATVKKNHLCSGPNRFC